jgi:glucosamine-6-phosphate deaminase
MPSGTHSVDRLEVRVLAPDEAARELAAEIAGLVRACADEGRPCVLGLATGRTPMALYAELVRLHRDEGLSFEGVTTVNLDEYEGVDPDDTRSFGAWTRAQLLDAVGIPSERALIPPPDLAVAAEVAWCRGFEERLRALGGVDLQVLGIGRNGHIGFNEPGSPRESRTRRVRLAAETREDAAGTWGGLDGVPTHAITLGVATILEARRLRALAFGEGKRDILRRALEEPVGPRVPATFLREHPDARLYADAAALGRS